MRESQNEHILKVENLRTVFHTLDGKVVAVDNVNYEVKPGEIVGIVGESGCGKSVTQYSLLQLIEGRGAIESGSVWYNGKDILKYKRNSKDMKNIRGGEIGLIFQEPISSLNPVLTVGRQIEESLRLHLGMKKDQARKRAIELLEMVGIPDAETRIDYYPHQFSGGMCQRVMIAIAISCEPKVLIADEATTALDVTTQEQVLELLKNIAEKTQTAIVIITHDLGVVARFAQRIYVMYAGRVVEAGSTRDIFYHAWHPYTKGLLRAVPRMDSNKEEKLVSIDGVPPRLINKPLHCDFYPRCKYADESCLERPFPERNVEKDHIVFCYKYQELKNVAQMKAESLIINNIDRTKQPILKVENLIKCFPSGEGFFNKKKDIKVLDGVSFEIHPGETLGLVGESGCGKSTISNCIMRFIEPTEGKIIFDDHDITHISKREMMKYRKDIQIVSQNPFASLDPRQTVGASIAEPLIVNRIYTKHSEIVDRIDELMTMVGLDPAVKDRMPHEFSGGQRQRICIARALALNPKLLICDEPVSALDVSIQAQIINLFMELKQKLGLSYLFIAHGLSVVRHISDRIIVMYMGQIVETADWKEIYENPQHPYTQALLSAVPIPDPDVDSMRKRIMLEGEVGSVANRIEGCNFYTRCQYATEECKRIPPVLKRTGEQHYCACINMNVVMKNQAYGRKENFVDR